jgi:hypothetical protein
MEQIRMFKDEQSMLVNNNGGVEVLSQNGWTIKVPDGWVDPEILAEQAAENLKNLGKENSDLKAVVEEMTRELDGLEKDTAPEKKPKK